MTDHLDQRDDARCDVCHEQRWRVWWDAFRQKWECASCWWRLRGAA